MDTESSQPVPPVQPAPPGVRNDPASAPQPVPARVPTEATPTPQPFQTPAPGLPAPPPMAAPSPVDVPAQQPVVSGQVSSSPIETPKKRKPRVLKILLGVVIVFVVLAGIGFLTFTHANSQVKGAEVVGNQFMFDMVNDNATAAYQLTSSAFQQNIPESKVAQTVSQIRTYITNYQSTPSSWNIINSTGQPETAKLSYSVRGSLGASTITLTLQKINGQWYVTYILTPIFPGS